MEFRRVLFLSPISISADLPALTYFDVQQYLELPAIVSTLPPAQQYQERVGLDLSARSTRRNLQSSFVADHAYSPSDIQARSSARSSNHSPRSVHHMQSGRQRTPPDHQARELTPLSLPAKEAWEVGVTSTGGLTGQIGRAHV